MNNLTTTQMTEVAQVFQDSVNHVLSNYEPEARSSLEQFIFEFIMKEKPYLVVTPEGLQKVISQVWSRDGIRDFIMKLSFTFFSRWGHPDATVSGLAENLARGAAMVVLDNSLNAVPKQLGERLSDIDAAQKVLAANRWLMIALMLPLFISVGELSRPLKK